MSKNTLSNTPIDFQIVREPTVRDAIRRNVTSNVSYNETLQGWRHDPEPMIAEICESEHVEPYLDAPCDSISDDVAAGINREITVTYLAIQIENAPRKQ